MQRSFLRWVVFVLALLGLGCDRDARVLARLEHTQGAVERDFAKQVGRFQGARPGATFAVGDAVRTLAEATAGLRLSDQSKLDLKPKTLVRFLDRPPGSKTERVTVETGEAEIIAGEGGLRIETETGIATIEPRTRLRLTKTQRGTRFTVAIGAAQLEVRGQKASIAAGQSVEVAIGEALLEPTAAPAASSAASPQASATPAVPLVVVDVDGPGSRARVPGEAERRALDAGRHELPSGTTLELPSGRTSKVSSGPASSMELTVPGGTIVANAGTDATVSVDGRSDAKVHVRSGSTTLKTAKDSLELRAGEQGVIERSGKLRLARSRGLDRADILVAAGESCTVHDPRPPTAIGFSVGSLCEGSALVELGRRGGRAASAAFGEHIVNLAAGPGTHAYTVRCLDSAGEEKQVAAGSISVMHDDGTRRLPSSAPVTRIDTDGRHYTVLYQNLLPKLFVRWPQAPASGPYALVVKSARGAQTLSTSSPNHTFSSGSLAEGSHEFVFEAAGKRSRATTVAIRFDNAAPTASLSSPAQGSFGPGATVLVAGTALPGWSVSVAGQELPQDEQHRFSGQASAPTGQGALAIRFLHPQRGTHYYLRRSH